MAVTLTKKTEKHPRLLALDISTKTGAVMFDKHDKMGHTSIIQFQPMSCRIERALRYKEAVADMIKQFSPHGCIVEGYGYANPHTLATLVEVGTLVRVALVESGIPWLEVPPASLKKFTTGKGNAKKELMMLEVFKRWGFEAKTNDQADAFALGQFGYSLLGFGKGLPESNMDAVRAVSMGKEFRESVTSMLDV